VGELLEPFVGLRGIADKFMKQYGEFFGLIKKVKEAYAIVTKLAIFIEDLP
jgi:hypothetical protein